MKRSINLSALIGILVLTGMIACCLSTDVRTVKESPMKYIDKYVTLKGTVDSLIEIPLSNKGLFELSDETGSIWVYTENGLPQKGRTVKVTGEVVVGATFANRTFGVVLKERPPEEKR